MQLQYSAATNCCSFIRFSEAWLIVIHRVLHRDLNPQNLLIDHRTNALTLADFGLVRAFGCDPLVQSTGDIAEMVNQRPLFRGDSEIDDLFKIFRIVGTPNEDTWPGVSSMPDFKSSFPKFPSMDLATLVPNLESAGVDLLCKMLCLDPSKKITARSALEHEYFKDIPFVH
ncbi:hypothetical protein M0R45_001198 [Rubus argutus]|uniref:cyclin-dependent kinase n=1 Tax=Rubus argutus TaxID=59490 RepID=A0AAW1VM20_RUBAR